MKLNKNQEYFKKLQQYFTKEIYDKYDSRISEIAELQKKTKEAVMKEIGNALLIYTIKNNVLEVNNRDKILLKSKFENLINQVFTNEIDSETDICSDIHMNVAKDKYYTNCYIFSKGVDYTLKPLHNNLLKKVIDKKIDGKTFSDRIWDNKNQVAKQVKLEVNKFLNGETDVNSINKVIEKKFNANMYNSSRLVRDSIGKVQEGANAVWRKEHDIKYVLWDATLDKRTCSECAAMDDKVFKNDDVPDCPVHVMCRCSLDSIPDKDWRPSQRIDNETKERVDWQSYEEWLKNQKQTGGKFTRGDLAWNDRRNNEAENYYKLIRDKKNDVKTISQNTGFSEKMIDKIKNHVFYNDKHILYGGRTGLLEPDYDMSVAWQRLINGKYENRDILLLRHEYLESGLEKRYNLTNKQAHDITTRKYDWWGKLVKEKGDLGEDDCLTEIIKKG